MVPLVSEFADLGEVRLAYRRFGSGDRLVVLVHGWPQTSACWRHITPNLGEQYTVVAPDLRGYGASGLATTGYDKRATARDLHELVQHLGFDSALVAAHDRGARVAHRWALDHPGDIERLAILDVLPTHDLIPRIDLELAKRHWHWLFHLQPELPEILLAGNTEPYLRYFFADALRKRAIDDDTLAEYFRAFEDPGHLSAGFDDYRAGFGIDLALDDVDAQAGRLVTCPLLLLWGDEGGLRDEDVLGIWRRYATDVRGDVVTGSGHYIPEEQPDVVVRRLREFFAGSE